ncbi:MAG: NPCBM/NEW2 domain-containing protein, partial [FCB group bacterium]|nr:NPCBM/NEW2 domain-containing protein [FCB group bacterium]
MKNVLVFVACLLGAVEAFAQAEAVVRLEELDLKSMAQGYGTPQKATSIVGKPLQLGGKVYEHGLGSHSISEYLVDVNDAARFEAVVGVDDETNKQGSVVFQLWVDGKLALDTGVLRGGDAPKPISVDLEKAKYLALVVTDAGDGNTFDHADWADAKFVLRSGGTERPGPLQYRDEPPPPIASGVPAEPQIHGPRVAGATPGRDFLFLIPATGEGTLKYAARNLPEGLGVDANTGIVSGRIAKAGEYDVEVEVSGAKGTAQRALKIVAGERKLALTPPMGWNSWYIHYMNVTEADIRAAADALVSTGLAAHGYQ